MAPSDTPTPREVVTAFMETWRDRPLHDGAAFLAPGATAWLAHAAGAGGTEPNTGTTFSGQRWLELLQPIVDRMPGGLTVHLHRVVADGAWVVVDTESRGEVPPSSVYNMRYTFWFHVEDGLVTELRQFFDTKYGEQFFLDAHFTH
ncbi:nuclear transport factor 2 family protein [Nocardioides zeae]|uniref:SnoaL-like domain-containing protein n=1 Tax=Nocardioides zeae TaxID=1457234 RepID=A0A6P0HKL1_9ACTN|nr:nuclear transport factor 2 family protein [Nocardioides zeae]NEN79163.1 hypothetical protein [Nocardioides zeae]